MTTDHQWKSATSDETGAALPAALLVVVILAGLAVVFVARANTEAGVSGFSVSFEQGLHAAEAAADAELAKVNVDPDYVTTVPILPDTGVTLPIDDSHAFVLPEGLSTAEEKEWALSWWEHADMPASTGWKERSGDGSGAGYAIRPVDEDGEPLPMIFSVAASPTLEGATSGIRVLKYQLRRFPFSPEHALMTGGDLKFGGSGSILSPDCDPDDAEATCIADVYVHGDYTNTGSGSTIEGEIQVFDGSCPGGVSAINGCVDDDVTEIPIPEIDATDFYDIERIREGANLGDPEFAGDEGWYDLCPDQRIRPYSESGPCTSDEVLWSSADAGNTRFRGWRWQAGQWRSSDIQSGVFYVHHADARINGSDGSATWDVSVIVAQDPGDPSGTGALDIQGNPLLQAALEDVLFIADTDIDLQGTPTGGTCGEDPETLSGLIALGEQLNVGGNVSLHGAILVEDAEDVHPLVRRNNMSVSGNMCLRFDPNLVLDFRSAYVIAYWNDLSTE